MLCSINVLRLELSIENVPMIIGGLAETNIPSTFTKENKMVSDT